MDTRRRSIYKAITYRILGTLVTGLIAFVFTGSLESASYIAVWDVILKIVLFYTHERAWLKVKEIK